MPKIDTALISTVNFNRFFKVVNQRKDLTISKADVYYPVDTSK